MKSIYTKPIYTFITCLMLAFFSGGANAQTWDFSEEGVGTNDEENLNADNTNWEYESSNNRWKNTASNLPNNSALFANDVELNFTKGLLFTASAADAIRLDNKKKCLTLNKLDAAITIKNLKKDDNIKVRCKTSSKTEGRGLTVTNITPVSGYFNQTTLDDQVNIGTVTEDGDVTLTIKGTTGGGLYIYEISVGEAGGTGGDTPIPDNYNSVSLNPNKNQIRLALTNSDIKYYNTEDVSVDIDKNAGTVTVTPIAGTWQDVYTKTVNNIDFTLAKDDTSSGEVTEGDVKIKNYDGWNEAAYIEWELLDEASSYAVYAKGGSIGNEYKKIDYQLVRKYSDYGRADIVGISKGTYSLKVVPLINDVEDNSKSSVVDGIEVIGHDRIGFAFANNKAPGAYNNDGTLKSNAVVIYITNANKDNVTYDVDVNGKGTLTTCTGFQGILNGIKKGNEKRPFVFRIIGQVGIPTGDKGDIVVDMNDKTNCLGVTIEGIGKDAVADGWGIRLKGCSSVEIRNLAFMNCSSNEGDNIGLQQSNEYIWVHHCDMFYGNAGSDADQIKGDGALDCKKSNYVTFSYNHFWDSGKACLLGLSGENDKMYITYHHNWFDHSDSRHPRIRSYSAHIYNNYYDGCAKYGVGSTMASSVFVENNYYRNTKRPMMISMQGTDIAGGNGTFSSESGGIIKSYGNVFAEKSSKFSYVTYQKDNVEFDAYEATSRNEEVPSEVKTKKGGTSYNNFDTDTNIMYEYTPDEGKDVVSVVTGKYGAGRLQHGDFKWSFNNSVDDDSYDVNKELKTAITNYKTSLVGIFDGENTNEGGNEGGDAGGDEGGDTGDDNTGGSTITASVECNFQNSAPSNNLFTVTGGAYSTSRGTATVNGQEYTNALKITQSVSITFTTEKEMTITLVLSSQKANTIGIDGTQYTADGDYIVTTNIPAGSHEIKKNGSEAALFYIGLSNIE